MASCAVSHLLTIGGGSDCAPVKGLEAKRIKSLRAPPIWNTYPATTLSQSDGALKVNVNDTMRRQGCELMKGFALRNSRLAMVPWGFHDDDLETVH
jgi:hypothetical protein